MSNGMQGADARALEDAARSLSREAAQMRKQASSISRSVHDAPWWGRTADTFRGDWTASAVPALKSASAFLDELVRELRQHASEQVRASAASNGGTRRAIGLLAVMNDRNGIEQLNRLTSTQNPNAALNVWSRMSEDERTWLIAKYPDVIGNLDGLPPSDRYAANRIAIQRDLLDLEMRGISSDRVKALRTILADDRQVYLYNAAGDGRIAFVDGDLQRATNVAVYVPGTGTTLDKLVTDRRGANINRLAGDSAVITWLDYDAPDEIVGTHRIIPSAWSDKADQGSKSLTSMLHGLQRRDDSSLTLIGHSYGGPVAGKAALLYGNADNVVFVASPGAGADSYTPLSAARIVAEAVTPVGRAIRAYDQAFGTELTETSLAEGSARDFGNTNVYSVHHPLDPVGHLPRFGDNPSSPNFGAHRFTDWSIDNGVDFHSNYFEPGSASLNYIADVVRGTAPGQTPPPPIANLPKF